MTKVKDENSARHITFSLIKFCLPLILSGILQQLYSWADAFIVGNAEGDLALAAIGTTSSVINLFVNTVTGFALGLSVLFAQNYGRRALSEIPRLLSTFMIFLGSIFLALSVAGVLLAAPFLSALQTPSDIFDAALGYLRIIFVGLPFLTIYNVISAALRGIGDSKTPFYAVLLSSGVNIALDIYFVAVLKAGVCGAAIATVISQVAMAVFIVIYSFAKHKLLRPERGGHLFYKKSFADGCRFSLPPMIQSSVSSFGNIILQGFMNGFGSPTVTAITTAYRIDSIIMIPITNLGSGISTQVAQRYGAGEKRRGTRIFKIGTILTAAVSVILTLAVIPTGGYLISLFGAGETAVKIGEAFFLRIACFYVVFGLFTAIRSYLEGIGDVLYSGLAGIASLISRIVASYAWKGIFGNMVIAYAEIFSWIFLLLLYIFRLVAKRKEMRE